MHEAVGSTCFSSLWIKLDKIFFLFFSIVKSSWGVCESRRDDLPTGQKRPQEASQAWWWAPDKNLVIEEPPWPPLLSYLKLVHWQSNNAMQCCREYFHCNCTLQFKTEQQRPLKNWLFSLKLWGIFGEHLHWAAIKKMLTIGPLSPLCCPILVVGQWMGTIWSKNWWRSIFSPHRCPRRHFLLDKEIRV